MKLEEFQTQMTGLYEEGICAYLKSPPGIGKTDTIVAAPKLIGERLGKNLGMVLLSGPLLTPADTVGYLVPKHHPDGRVESLYSEPFWWRTSEGKRLEEYDGGIIFMDEADKADVDVKKVIGEAALSRRLGPHRIPEGWVVWMAGNTAEHRSGSTKELDHLINRRAEIDIVFDLAGWLNWASTHGVSPVGMACAEQNPQILMNEKMPEKQGPWCTPRSFARADRYLQRIADGGDMPNDPVTCEVVNGMIGAGATTTLMNFVKLQREMPRYDAIVAAPSKAKVPTKPDAQMLVAYQLASQVSHKDVPQVVEYVERMPKEFAVTFAKSACKRDKTLVTSPAFLKWAQTNASLMAMIS